MTERAPRINSFLKVLTALQQEPTEVQQIRWESLRPMQMEVLGLRFGVNPLTQEKVGFLCKISQARVGQIERAAFKVLREGRRMRYLFPVLFVVIFAF